MRVLVLGYGNPRRGDDGLGPALVETLAGRFPHLTCQLAFQLQPEHVLDLAACGLALFIDAGVHTPAPFAFSRLQPQRDLSAFSHAPSPSGLLAVYQQVFRADPPPAFVLTVAGESFGFVEGLSPKARSCLRAALGFAETLLSQPELAYWEAACTSCP